MLVVRCLAGGVICGALMLGGGQLRGGFVSARSGPQVELLQARQADSDLEIRGVGISGSEFVSRASLEALPLVDALVRSDENFTEMPKEGVTVRGVDFGVLEEALGVLAETESVEAVCSDGYNAPLPPEYVRQHHPILVLTIKGLTPGKWAAKTHTGDMGPYFVAYDRFAPGFRVLSHEDRPQVPVQLIRLEFAPPAQMFAGILPSSTANANVTDGYRIAQQNCFRCHNAGGYGGTKSGRSWSQIGRDARNKPEWFANWVHDAKSVDRRARMPSNLNYDRATLTALTEYFSTIR